MAQRLIRLLTLAALLLAPFAMEGGHAAAPASAPAVHCDEPMGADPADEDGASARIDCAIACSAVPTAAGILDERARPVAMVEGAVLPILLDGHGPGADPPPPRRG